MPGGLSRGRSFLRDAAAVPARPRPRAILGFTLPLLLLALQWALWPILQPFAWALFYPSVLLAVWLGGTAAGLTASVIWTALVVRLFVPVGAGDGRGALLLPTAIYLSTGVVISLAFGRAAAATAEALRALRASETTLSRAQAVAHIGSWYLDVARNQLTWSPEVYRIFGIAPGTPLTYDAFLAHVHPDDRDTLDRAWKTALHGTPYDVEHRILVNNRVRWVRERAQVEFDTTGSAAEGVGTVQDITERKAAEETMRRLYRAERALSRCNQALVRATDEPTLFQQVCDTIVEDAGYRLCWIGRAEHDDAKSVRPVAWAGLGADYLETASITWSDTPRGRGPAGTSIRSRETVVVKDIAAESLMAPWREEALKRGYASLVSIPLVVDGDVFGAILIYSAEPRDFDTDEVQLLTELADDLTFGIGTLRTRQRHDRAEQEIRTLNAQLERRVAERTAELQAAHAGLERAREHEIEIGFRIQQTLLLDEPPADVPGLRIAALTVPSQRIDGDFYAFIRHPGHVLDAVVGDVMGKGVPAALVGAAAKSHFLRAIGDLMPREPGDRLPEPHDIVMLAHAGVVRHLIALESFVTVCYARFDVPRRRLVLVDCGHTGIVHLHAAAGSADLVRGVNLPLGVREGEIYEQSSVPYDAGDLFLLYSDGITEARNGAGEPFGIERLMRCLRDTRGREPSDIVQHIRRAVVGYSHAERLTDDVTAVAVATEPLPLPAASDALDIGSDLGELRRVRAFVRAFCARVRDPALGDARVAALELAVNEVVSNVIKHAYHGHPHQRIHLEAEAYADRLTVLVHHLGDAFDRSTVVPPALDGSRESGFGVYIIERSVDLVRYYRDERGRHCVALTVHRFE